MKSKLFVPVLVAIVALAGCKPALSSSVFESTVTSEALQPVTQAVVSTGASAIDPTQAPTAEPTAAPTQATTAVPTPDVPFPPTWQGELPILTSDNQGMTFGPGQWVMALVTGFEAGETLTVSVIHADAGILASLSDTADASGSTLMYYQIPENDQVQGALPAGEITFSYHGESSGLSKKYAFTLDYQKRVHLTPAQCGFIDNGLAVFWCGGLQPGESPSPFLSVDGETVATWVDNTADSSGLVMGTYLLNDLPDGWQIVTFQAGDHRVSLKRQP